MAAATEGSTVGEGLVLFGEHESVLESLVGSTRLSRSATHDGVKNPWPGPRRYVRTSPVPLRRAPSSECQIQILVAVLDPLSFGAALYPWARKATEFWRNEKDPTRSQSILGEGGEGMDKA